MKHRKYVEHKLHTELNYWYNWKEGGKRRFSKVKGKKNPTVDTWLWITLKISRVWVSV